MNFDELAELCRAIEGETLEFKRTTSEADEGAKTLSAMANRRGGRVIFGVGPDHSIVGQTITERTLEKLFANLNEIRPGPDWEYELVPTPSGGGVLIVSVPRGPLRPYRHKGFVYERLGAVTTKVSEERAQLMAVEAHHGASRWETEISSLTVGDLDSVTIKRTLDDGVSRGRILNDSLPHSLLRGLGVIDGDDRLLNAGAVVFGSQSSLERSLPQCHVKLGRFPGGDKFALPDDDRQRFGGVFDLIQQAESFCRDHLGVRTRADSGSFSREDRPEIPLLALREALANAFAHRDYGIGGGAVSLAIFNDRVEVTSPGPLHWGITVSSLLTEHSSQPWNPLIARCMYRRGLIETWGSGIGRMIGTTRSAGLFDPAILANDQEVRVTFTRPGHVPRWMAERGAKLGHEDVLLALQPGSAAISELEALTGVSRRTLQRDLQRLADLDIVKIVGTRRGAKWQLAAPSGA